jgi:3-methyl-2-oxobutanoate hydroxymethyltransferase
MTQTIRLTAPAIAARKSTQPLVCLTAYTAPMARALDPHCDLLLVGDSLAMVVYGLESTLGADMDMMVRHGQAVVRASQKACIVVDMPFGSYQASPAQAFDNAARILKETGAQGIKLEGGIEMADTIAFLTARGIPVMGHIGLQPQSVNTLGGYKAQGREDASAQKIKNDARAVAQAGAFSMVIEGVAESLAATITKDVAIPTIGIGASATCDGQILVSEDMLGITVGKKPKFVKEYAELAGMIDRAAAAYADDVRARAFPGKEQVYTPLKVAKAS